MQNRMRQCQEKSSRNVSFASTEMRKIICNSTSTSTTTRLENSRKYFRHERRAKTLHVARFQLIQCIKFGCIGDSTFTKEINVKWNVIIMVRCVGVRCRSTLKLRMSGNIVAAALLVSVPTFQHSFHSRIEKKNHLSLATHTNRHTHTFASKQNLKASMYFALFGAAYLHSLIHSFNSPLLLGKITVLRAIQNVIYKHFPN